MQILVFSLFLFTLGCFAQTADNNVSPPDNSGDFHKLVLSQDGKAPCRVIDKIVPHGQEYTHPDQCINFTCYDGQILELDFCDALKTTGPNCVIVPIRKNLDYPWCCPKVVCD
ncbi:hypothetical protein DMENIID0001_132830 [Sergentomyia squamirostris]